MKNINRLQDDTISKIAAGEVVERPTAIIKELFENAVDAGSTEITVEILAGGKDFIKVTDNGHGIDAEDLPLLFERHATSKIRSIGDLYSLHTMGFRGEALHSIAAVSKVVCVTKTEREATGRRIEIMGGEILSESASACNTGTSMEVTDLFYNTPVRWKFLKTTTQENRQCIDMVSKLAIANAHISVTFIADHHLLFKTDGKGDLRSAVFQVYGKGIAEELMKIEFKADGLSVHGLSSKFSLRKRNRNFIMTFVNGRYVKSTELQRSIEGCYFSHLMGGEFPVTFLFLDIDPAEIDVNVHPAKTEIKFSDFNYVNRSISSALKRAFQLHTHIPNVAQTGVYTKRFEYVSSGDEKEERRSRIMHEEPDATSFAIAETQLRYDASKPLRESVDSVAPVAAGCADSLRISSQERLSSAQCDEIDYSPKSAEKPPEAQQINVAPEESAPNWDMETRQGAFEEMKLIGVFDRTYVLAERDRQLFLIDQHAAHEKILFEEYTASVAARKVHSQMLLLPFEMEVEPGYEWPDLEPLGFALESFGHRSVVVRAVPAGMDEGFARRFLSAVFAEVWDGSSPYDLATKACKAAIKGGDSLQIMEVEELIRKLSALSDPYNCPHGRPVIVSLSRRDIDRMFRRIL